jgi:hypothetical protein
MTRREKALRAARRIRGGATASGGDLYALADEYDDLLAFLDAMENDGLVEAYGAYKVYCENQVNK